MKEKIKVFNRVNDGFFIEAHIADLHFEHLILLSSIKYYMNNLYYR